MGERVVDAAMGAALGCIVGAWLGLDVVYRLMGSASLVVAAVWSLYVAALLMAEMHRRMVRRGP